MPYINEELHREITKYLKYMLLIDVSEILENNRGMITYLFPDVKLQKLLTWFAPFSESEIYSDKEIKNTIKSINSRFRGDETLKLLYRSLNKILSTPYNEDERGERESDINKMVRKINIYIKNKLTDDDLQHIETIFAELDKTASFAKAKIINMLDRYMSVRDEPKPEEEDEEPSDVEKTEKDDDVPKKESLHDGFYKRKLRKKIREMIRTAVISKRFK
jgi:hypothetical protein